MKNMYITGSFKGLIEYDDTFKAYIVYVLQHKKNRGVTLKQYHAIAQIDIQIQNTIAIGDYITITHTNQNIQYIKANKGLIYLHNEKVAFNGSITTYSEKQGKIEVK
jgi:hypothetical protein